MIDRLFRLHGLSIQSDLDLQGELLAMGSPDLVIAAGPGRLIADEPPAGRIIAEASGEGRRFYTAVATEAGTVVRFHRLCDFVFSGDGTQITWHAAPEVGAETVAIMAAGTVLASAAILGGHLVLHASAVAIDGRALAFVGMSGMGKSTLAAHLCRRHGRLITDDVLRVDGDRCYLGAREVRLMPQGFPVVEGLGTRSRPTADGRMAVALESADADTFPLQAIIVPHIDREGRAVFAEQIRGRDAVLLLTGFPRVLGWQDPNSGRQQFELLVDLVQRIPIWRCRVPWGPPFVDSVADEILDAIGWPPASSVTAPDLMTGL